MMKKLLVPTAAVAAVLVLSATPAFAHHCWVVNRSAQGATSVGAHSKVWVSFTLAEILPDPEEEFGLCPARISAGVAAVSAAGLPTVLATRVDKTLLAGTGAQQNGRTGDGKGIDHFEDSPVIGEMLETVFAAVETVACE